MNDVLLAEVASILKCLKRVQEDFENENTFRNNITKQDAVVLNLQRACEASIDVANHIVKEKRLGLPKSGRESFELLSKNELIQAETALRMRNMIGFRNIAIHDYQALNLDVDLFCFFQLKRCKKNRSIWTWKPSRKCAARFHLKVCSWSRQLSNRFKVI
jgi:uncharacterized protein YutE (UPF0331/DUF86 family)